MDIQEFRARGKEMVEYICEFMSNIHNRRVTPDVGPGYLRPLLPSEAPQHPEPWEDIMKDVESKVMPGVSEKRNNSQFFVLQLPRKVAELKGSHSADHPLATPEIPRVLPRRELLPIHPRRHVIGRDRLHRILMGENCLEAFFDFNFLERTGPRPVSKLTDRCLLDHLLFVPGGQSCLHGAGDDSLRLVW